MGSAACIHNTLHTTALRASFDTGICDAARQALNALRCQEDEQVHHSQYHHFSSQVPRSFEVHVHTTVRNNPTKCLGEQVKLTQAMDQALSKVV
jgi:predicted amidophosphoribosyltransferase